MGSGEFLRYYYVAESTITTSGELSPYLRPTWIQEPPLQILLYSVYNYRSRRMRKFTKNRKLERLVAEGCVLELRGLGYRAMG